MIGIDIVSISRIEKIIDKFGDKALDKFLTNQEKAYIKNSANAAGFWAAKEAASKALGTGIGADCTFHDIHISKTQKGAPQLNFSDQIVSKFKIKQASLSITHDGGFAIAAVIIETSN